MTPPVGWRPAHTGTDFFQCAPGHRLPKPRSSARAVTTLSEMHIRGRVSMGRCWSGCLDARESPERIKYPWPSTRTQSSDEVRRYASCPLEEEDIQILPPKCQLAQMANE